MEQVILDMFYLHEQRQNHRNTEYNISLLNHASQSDQKHACIYYQKVDSLRFQEVNLCCLLLKMNQLSYQEVL